MDLRESPKKPLDVTHLQFKHKSKTARQTCTSSQVLLTENGPLRADIQTTLHNHWILAFKHLRTGRKQRVQRCTSSSMLPTEHAHVELPCIPKRHRSNDWMLPMQCLRIFLRHNDCRLHQGKLNQTHMRPDQHENRSWIELATTLAESLLINLLPFA